MPTIGPELTIPFTIGAGPAQSGGVVISGEVYSELGPLAQQDPAHGNALEALNAAIGSMFAQTEEAVRGLEGFDPYSQTLDVNRTPGWLLPFFSQFVGVPLPSGLTESQQRALIEAEGGWRRGWLTSFLAAISSTLTGTKRIRLTERNSSAWTVLVNTKPSETPSLAATEAAGNLQLPGGMIATYVTIEAPLIDEGAKTIDAVAFSIDAATIAQVS